MPPRPTAAKRLSPLARLVESQVKTQHLFEPGARLLAAVSGGPDSVALLALLAELAPGWSLGLAAMHINHGLRGEESDEDARFVARLCQDMGIELRSARLSLDRGPAGNRRQSLQERAREVRYRALLAEGRSLGVDRIVLGHQADDQAETLLMWMLRGAGATGLAGIPPIREALFVRPLLGIARSQIMEYLRERSLAFRNDSSNVKPVYLRNRIRQDLLPLLKIYNPAIVEVLTRQAKVLKEEDLYLQERVADALAALTLSASADTVLVDRTGFSALPVALQRRAVRLLFQRLNASPQGPNFSLVESVINQVFRGRNGSSITSRGITMTREYAVVRFHSVTAEVHEDFPAGLPLSCPSVLRWPLTGQSIRAGLASDSTPPNPRHREVAVFDLDRFTMALTVRSWRNGDVFQPAGMQGRQKKLQDFFSDSKVPRQQRGRVPLVVAPEGIVWVAGHRADHRFIASPGTRRRLILELLSGSSGGGTD